MQTQNPATMRQEIRQPDADQEGKIKGVPADGNDIPVPPSEDVPVPIHEPFEEDKPNEPIIDDEKKAPKLIV
jgi:hypothetical protein